MDRPRNFPTPCYFYFTVHTLCCVILVLAVVLVFVFFVVNLVTFWLGFVFWFWFTQRCSVYWRGMLFTFTNITKGLFVELSLPCVR